MACVGGPPFYCALADFGTRPTTLQCPPGGCGAKGSTTGQNILFIDPDFGSLGVRASDVNTAPLYLGSTIRSIHGSPNESEAREWNSDGTKFYVPTEGGALFPAFFNPSTMQVRWIVVNTGTGISSHHPQASYAAWSGTNPNLLYGINSSAPTVYSYDFSGCADPGSGTYTTCNVTQSLLYDWTASSGAECPGLNAAGGWNPVKAGTYISAWSVDGNTVGTTLGAGSSQDQDYIVTVWNTARGCLWLNTHTFMMGGDTDAAHWNMGVSPGTPIQASGFTPAPAPPAPALSTASTGGSLSNGTYTVGVTYTNNWTGQINGGGESLTGNSNITLSGGTFTQDVTFSAPSGDPAVVNTSPPNDWAGLYNSSSGGYNVYACSGASCSPTWQPGNPTLTISGFSCTGDLGAGSTVYTYSIVPFSSSAMGIPQKCTVTQAARPATGTANVTTLNWTSASAGVTGCAVVLDDLTAGTTTVFSLNNNFACASTLTYADSLNAGSVGSSTRAFQLESVKAHTGTFTLGSITTGLAPEPTSTTNAPNGTAGGGIHQIVLSHDGSWLIVRAGARFLWNLGTTTVREVDSNPIGAGLSAAAGQSNYAGANGHEALGGILPGGTAPQWFGRNGGTADAKTLLENDLLTSRALDSAFITNPYRANFTYYPGSTATAFPSPTLSSGNVDAHPTTESIEKSGAIFFTSFLALDGSYTNGYVNAESKVRAWDRELYGMSTLTPPTVYRFASDHNMGVPTYNLGINSSGQTSTCVTLNGYNAYWDCGFLAVSRDGKFALVFSSWDDSLGCENTSFAACTSPLDVYDSHGQLQSAGTGEGARIDAFIYKLQ
jgi:hypothetical protein